MGQTLTLAAVGAVAFMVLDAIWLGLLIKNFYREQLAPMVRLADGGVAFTGLPPSSSTSCSASASPCS